MQVLEYNMTFSISQRDFGKRKSGFYGACGAMPGYVTVRWLLINGGAWDVTLGQGSQQCSDIVTANTVPCVHAVFFFQVRVSGSKYPRPI